ncbi:MAG: hypothetical protein KF814_08965 [Nitrospiraceae bacterium]|nr:hypothetical protein [Nitrospiraceae bacterium]
MVLAGAFAIVLFIGLIIGDWAYFIRLTSDASRYGYALGRTHERCTALTESALLQRFDGNGVLSLPHGVARIFPEAKRILVRPTYRLLSMRFRTAWPIKGSVEWTAAAEGAGVDLTCVKRVPWSSALLTLSWFGLVGFGTLGFLISFVREGGLSSLGGVLLGVGVTGVGLIVLAFGLLTLAVAYRLENTRLLLVYDEFREATLGAGTPPGSPPAEKAGR